MYEKSMSQKEHVIQHEVEQTLKWAVDEHDKLSKGISGEGVAHFIIKEFKNGRIFDTDQGPYEAPINLGSLGKIPFAVEALRQAKFMNIAPGYTRIEVPLSAVEDGDPLHQILNDAATTSRLSIQREQNGMLSMPLTSAIELTLGVSSNDSLIGIGAWLRDQKKSQIERTEGEGDDAYIDRLREEVANDVERMAHCLIKKNDPSKEPIWSTRNSTRSKENISHNTGRLSEAMAMLEVIVTSAELADQIGQDGLVTLQAALKTPSGHILESRDGMLGNAYTKYGLWGNNEKGDFGTTVPDENLLVERGYARSASMNTIGFVTLPDGRTVSFGYAATTAHSCTDEGFVGTFMPKIVENLNAGLLSAISAIVKP